MIKLSGIVAVAVLSTGLFAGIAAPASADGVVDCQAVLFRYDTDHENWQEAKFWRDQYIDWGDAYNASLWSAQMSLIQASAASRQDDYNACSAYMGPERPNPSYWR